MDGSVGVGVDFFGLERTERGLSEGHGRSRGGRRCGRRGGLEERRA